MTTEVKKSETTQPTKEEALAAYNLVVEKAKLQDIRLVDVKFDVKTDYYSAKDDDSVAVKLKRNFDWTFSSFAYDRETQSLGASFDWSLDVSQGKSKKLLSLKAKYIVLYVDIPDVDQRHSEAFVQRVGRFATYPYFRGLAAQLSWEAQADLPTLPVLK